MNNQNSSFSGKGRNLAGSWRTGIPISNPTITNSVNYRGDLSNPRNVSADIPEGDNCATWWTNLPPNCTYEMLFDSMRHVGAISHAVINPPVGSHQTSAAKVEFFNRASVDRLMSQVNNGHLRGHIRVGGRIPHITMNRVKVAAHANAVPREHGNGGKGTRVLQVRGSPEIISQEILEAILASPLHKVIYGLECARTTVRPDGNLCVEIRFASFVVQAARARDVFMSQKQKRDLTERQRALWAAVTCVYAPDPCE